ncbi:hypothetical protein BJ165DRAFT_1505710 [Panaeolus papilionaceus]|nr:hypothetical protein BJ165DRAFT_1505710 [Panaeolus papilionaceus]
MSLHQRKRMKFFAHPDLQLFRKEALEPSLNHVYYIKRDDSRSTSTESYFCVKAETLQHTPRVRGDS